MGFRWQTGRRRSPLRQGVLPFLQRSQRLERVFKLAIIGFTLLVILGMILGTGTGRRLVVETPSGVRDAFANLLGTSLEPEEYSGRRQEQRRLGIELTRENLVKVENDHDATFREFLRVTRLDHDSALIRWGNFDWTLALSSAVFEADDSGRSYRLRPNTRSVWLINLSVHNVLAMFEIPDTPEARRLGESVGGRIVPESVQNTNSWGCRGPEPDLSAPVRVMVLGDSNMQGLLVADDQTPSSRLEVRLREEMDSPVSVLNTGHLGYSPEQYYYTLRAYFDRWHPHYVVINLCANDFGDMNVAANWEETDYWLDAITQFCRTREVDFLVVPLPREDNLIGSRNQLVYPAKVTAILDASAKNYLDPIEEFATEEIEQRLAAQRKGRPLSSSPLFNRRYNDNHMSAIGCDLWARIVARRIRLILAQKAVRESAPVARPSGATR